MRRGFGDGTRARLRGGPGTRVRSRTRPAVLGSPSAVAISVNLLCTSQTNEGSTDPSPAHATPLACHEVEHVAVATVPVGAVHSAVYCSFNQSVETPDNVVILGHGLLAPFAHRRTVQVMMFALCTKPLCLNAVLFAELHGVLHLPSSLIYSECTHNPRTYSPLVVHIHHPRCLFSLYVRGHVGDRLLRLIHAPIPVAVGQSPNW